MYGKQKEITHEHSKDHLQVDNVFIHNLGPFRFSTKSKLVALCGENGVGKTQLAMAIADLIPYSGKIIAPKTIYIGLKSLPNLYADKNSMGENALKTIDGAIANENAQLIIIDELLDILSQSNLKNTLNKLKECSKMIILITHSSKIINEADEKIIL